MNPLSALHEPALARSPAFRRQDVRPAKAGTPCQPPPFMAPMRDARIVEAPPERGRADLLVGPDAPQRVPTMVQGLNARRLAWANSRPGTTLRDTRPTIFYAGNPSVRWGGRPRE